MPTERARRTERDRAAWLRLAREARELKKHLTSLTISVRNFLVLLDREMRQPSSPGRGRRIAKLASELELYNDQARYFGLGVDYRKDKKLDVTTLLPQHPRFSALEAVAQAAKALADSCGLADDQFHFWYSEEKLSALRAALAKLEEKP